jgi:hypothetical protein
MCESTLQIINGTEKKETEQFGTNLTVVIRVANSESCT